ncbi:MAG: efflux RND transporter periplasmic adaptor subunit [bacterium]|nr:efflux RND transporter periplasmic adaptor subunit [bacterium]
MKRYLSLTMLILLIAGCAPGESNEIIVSGTVEVREIRISSELPGKVIDISANDGDSVEQDKVLVKLDDLQYKIQLNAAEIQKEQVIALLNDSELDYNRAKNLYQANSIPKEQFNKAELNFKINKLRLKEIEENIELLKLYISKTEIKTPVSGIIYEKYIEPGEVVAPGYPLFLLHDFKDFYIKTYIPEKYIGMVTTGDKVYLKIDSYPEKRFNGSVSFISNVPEFTPSTLQTEEQRVIQVYEIRIVPSDGIENFKPGLFTTVIFQKKKI